VTNDNLSSTASYRHYNLERTATTGLFLVNGLGIGAWAATIPRLATELALSSGQLGIALFVFACGAVITMPLSGWLGQRFGTAKMSRFAAFAFGITLLLPPLAANLTALALAALVFGAANGAMDVSMNAHASSVETHRGVPIMSSFHAAFSGGGLVGAALVGLQPTLTLELIGAASCLLAIASARALQPSDSIADAGVHFSWPGRAALPLCYAAFGCMLCEGAMADWSGVYLIRIASASEHAAANGYVGFSAAMFVIRFIGDSIVARLGRSTVVAAGALLAAFGFALATALPQPTPIVIGFACVGIGLANVVPALFSAAGRVGPSPAAGVSMVSTGGYTGFLTGPVVISAAAQFIGLRGAMTLLIAFSIGVALLARSVKR
jgi:MFS family permease